VALHSERSLSDLLDELAAQTPAPGGGSSAAWATAIAAALTEMAARFTPGASPERASELRVHALELAERELSAYAPVLEASRLPKDDPSRAERLSKALSDAADSPLEIARTAAEVAELARELAQNGNRTLEGDANTGAELASAACRAAARLVEINLQRTPDDPRLVEARQLRTKNQELRTKN
jgi:formiminotetrahydrofolate cyclodeaminase